MRLLANVDLKRDFFFSYTYPLTSSLQEVSAGKAGCPWSSPFCWNAHLAHPLAACLGGLSSPAMRRWLLPLMHGSFGATSLALCGTPVSVVLLARRSSRFAGTRYRKRGVNDAGDVANYVETEQIVDAGAWPCRRPPRGVRRDYPPYAAVPQPPPPRCSSVVQVRGSIPLFWSQQASPLSPKPDIMLARHDPFYEATKKHFSQLQARYGACVALSLVKASEKRPRETLLRREFAAAIDAINATSPVAGIDAPSPPPPHVVLCSWDFSRRAKRSHAAEVLRSLSTLCTGALAITGVFVTPRPVQLGVPPRSRASSAAAQAAASSLGWVVDGGDPPTRVARSAFRAAGAESVLGPESEEEEDAAEAAAGGLLHCSPGEGGDPFGAGCQQVGVLRTNCIDCLDRTNVAQFAYGVTALGVQLMALELSDEATLAADSPLVESLSLLYQHMGDALAWQYGGSDAHSHMLQAAAVPAASPSAYTAAAVGPQGGPGAIAGIPGAVGGLAAWRTAGSYSRQWLTSAQRFYSATVTDGEKQDAINLFLGHFVPQRGRPALWELDNDVWLHARATGLPAIQQFSDSTARVGNIDPTAWSALNDGRRSPFGRASLSEAAGSLASFDVWADPPLGWAPLPPAVRIYPPGLRSGFTVSSFRSNIEDGVSAAGNQKGGSTYLAASKAAQRAATARVRSFYSEMVAKGQFQPGSGLGLSTADEQQAAAQRYAHFCTDAKLWNAIFAGAAAAREAAERSRQDDVMDPASLVAFEHADRAALDLIRASILQAVRTAPMMADTMYSGEAEDPTLAAAQAFLSAPDDLAPLPEWTMPTESHEQADTNVEASTAVAKRSSETQAAAAPGAMAYDHPPPPGSDLRRWLAAREADAYTEMTQAIMSMTSLGDLGLGVLMPAPPAANVHSMKREQLSRLSAAPEFEDPRPRLPQARASSHTPKLRLFSSAAAFTPTRHKTVRTFAGDGEQVTGWAFTENIGAPPAPSV